jgi:hypothetical protein
MINAARSAFESALRVLSGLLSSNRHESDSRIHGVIVHDPDAQKPKDLDNPFYEAGTQERIGAFIARAIVPADRKSSDPKSSDHKSSDHKSSE